MRGLCALVIAAVIGAAPACAEDVRPADPATMRALAEVSPARLEADDRALVAFGTRSTFSERAPSGRGVFAARAWLLARLRAIAATTGGRMTVALDSYVRHPDGERVARDVKISSVIATLKGDEPGGRTYVMSAHYDSRNSSYDDSVKDAPGADDNGSGTVAVLEAARVLATLRPRATIVFAIFDAEEQGLLGAEHYANGLKAAGVDVQGDLNNDIVGSSLGRGGAHDGGTVRIFSEAVAAGADAARVNAVGNEDDSPSRELARYARAVGDVYVPGLRGERIDRADRFLRGGDHEAFNAAGFAAIRFVEPFETYEHQHQDVRVDGGVRYGDLPEHMDWDYLARVTRYNVAVLAALATGPGRPVARVETKELTNDTVLSWSAVAGAAAYEVVTRRTTEAEWGAVAARTAGLRARLPISKDNRLFGVRAVDGEGRIGVMAFPLPEVAPR